MSQPKLFPIQVKRFIRLTTTEHQLGSATMGGIIALFWIIILADGGNKLQTVWWWTAFLVTVLPFAIYFWYAKRIGELTAETTEYRLEGHVLHISRGIWTKTQAAIPLNQVTDITLVQGPLLKRQGLWNLTLHSTGVTATDFRLIGLEDPEGVREELLALTNR